MCQLRLQPETRHRESKIYRFFFDSFIIIRVKASQKKTKKKKTGAVDRYKQKSGATLPSAGLLRLIYDFVFIRPRY